MKLHRKQRDDVLLFVTRPEVQGMTAEQLAEVLKGCKKYKKYKTSSGLTSETWAYVIGITQAQDYAYSNRKKPVPSDVMERALCLSRKMQHILTHYRNTEVD